MDLDPLVGKALAAAHHCTHRLNIFEGSVRSGKTIASLLAWMIYVRTGPAGNLAMIGKTERTLKRNCIDPLIEMVGTKRCDYRAGSGELFLFGRRIYVAGANDERAQEKIRGLTLAGAYVDEASILPESMWSMLLTRLSVDGARLFATSNPDSPNHWLLRDYLLRAKLWLTGDGTMTRPDGELDLARFSFRLADNPSLSQAYVDALAAEFTGLWYRRFVLGEWVLAEGSIFDMFDPAPHGDHVVHPDEVPDIADWWLAVDYGTTNPFVAVLLGEGADGCLYAMAEWRWDSKAERRQLTDSEYSKRLRSWLAELCKLEGMAGCDRPARVFVDPSAASFIAQLYRDDWGGVRGADNAVEDGLRSVANLLSGGRLRFVGSRHTGGLVELADYAWDPKAQEKGEDRPLKTRDHYPDALRYGVMGTERVWRHWQPRAVGGAAEAA